ncbi:Ubiquitin carboxyl-terminal hydrolase 2 [Choanephora cucurbitarum]|uniref:Ubiquitin carboxyl-terminal hydrolase n=1 Tax=Choanephora cucurbitarum TaxID=101091 RepID=A0A1C7NIH1_9FUNG|nr:Ubiquitin carboxyl-terminal hydrolase 2 [Choanephora cucurbitarum]
MQHNKEFFHFGLNISHAPKKEISNNKKLASKTRKNKRPVGLSNIGNTCYFNSLVQYYYTIVSFRETMVHYKNCVEDENNTGSIKVDQSKIPRAKRFVALLKDLFCNIRHCKKSAISPEYNLACMALLNEEEDGVQEEKITKFTKESPSQLVEQNDINNSSQINVDDDVQNTENIESVDIEMTEAIQGNSDYQYAFNEAAVNDKDILLVDSPSYKSIGSEQRTKHLLLDAKKHKQKEELNVNSMMFGRQQDLTECMGNIMYLVEAALKTKDGKQVDDVVRQTFYGKTCQILSYYDDTTLQKIKKEQEEDFAYIIVNTKEGSNLYEVMDNYFFANQVNFQGGHDATREVIVKSFPPILQIHIQRVQFNRELVHAYKSNAHVQFDKVIYLDRYTEELKDKRAQLATWRAELDKITQRVKKAEKFLVKRSKEEMKQIGHNLKLVALFKEYRRLIKRDNRKIKKLEKKIQTQYKDHTKVAYKLHAVFIHQGQANYGHYWVYILDHAKDQWWKYNDSLVTEVDENEIFHSTTGSATNPYFLAYVDANRIEEYVETIPQL